MGAANHHAAAGGGVMAHDTDTTYEIEQEVLRRPVPQPAGEGGAPRMQDNSLNGNDAIYVEPKLEPCPFCGVVPPSDSYYMNQGDKWGGIQCCIQGPEVRTYYEEWPKWKQAAIDAWNTRATPTDVAERARRAGLVIRDALWPEFQMTVDAAERLADIIAAEFGGESQLRLP